MFMRQTVVKFLCKAPSGFNMASKSKGYIPTYDVLWTLYKKSEVDIKELRKQLQSSRQQLDKMHQEKRVVPRPSGEMKEKLARAQEAAAENQRKMCCVQDQNRDLEMRQEILSKQVEQYRTQSEEYQNACLKSEEKKKSLAKHLKEVEESINRIEENNRELEKKEETALKEVEELKVKCEQNYKAFLNSEEDRKSCYERLKEVEESEKKVVELVEEIKKSKEEEMEGASKAINELRQEMDSLKNKLTKASQETEELQRTTSQLYRDMTITRLEGKMEINNKKNMISDLKEEIQRLTTENNRMKNKKRGFLSRIFCCFRIRRGRR